MLRIKTLQEKVCLFIHLLSISETNSRRTMMHPGRKRMEEEKERVEEEGSRLIAWIIKENSYKGTMA